MCFFRSPATKHGAVQVSLYTAPAAALWNVALDSLNGDMWQGRSWLSFRRRRRRILGPIIEKKYNRPLGAALSLPSSHSYTLLGFGSSNHSYCFACAPNPPCVPELFGSLSSHCLLRLLQGVSLSAYFLEASVDNAKNVLMCMPLAVKSSCYCGTKETTSYVARSCKLCYWCRLSLLCLRAFEFLTPQ